MGSQIYADCLLGEFMTLSAGKLTYEELAAHVTLINLYIIMITFGLGVSNVLLNFVGCAMGENKPKKAIKYTIESCILTFVVLCPIFVLTLFFR